MKTGPLTVLNRGYAGKQIGRMLADGLLDGQDAVARAAGVLAGSAAFTRPDVRAPRGTSNVRAARLDQVQAQATAPVSVTATQNIYNPVRQPTPSDMSGSVRLLGRMGLDALATDRIMMVPA